MSTGSIPQARSRVSVTLFARDLLARQHLVQVEHYPSSGYVGARFTDGAGVEVALSGDRSSVRMVLAAALEQLAGDEPTAGRRPDAYLDGMDHDTGQGG